MEHPVPATWQLGITVISSDLRAYARSVGRFVRFLSEHRLVETTKLSELRPIDVRVMQIQQRLRQHGGIAECTISKHAPMVTRLVAALGPDPTHYTVAAIRQDSIHHGQAEAAR